MQNSSPLDDIDRRIVQVVTADGRISMRQLADAVPTSRANAYRRIQRLQEDGVITGFTAVTDPVALGFTTAAYVTLSIQQAQWRTIQTELLGLPGVEHFALVGGVYDVILLVRARDNAHLRRLVLDNIQAVDGVVSTHTLLVFEESHPGNNGCL